MSYSQWQGGSNELGQVKIEGVGTMERGGVQGNPASGKVTRLTVWLSTGCET